MHFLFFYRSILSFLHSFILVFCIIIFIEGFFSRSIGVFKVIIVYPIRYFSAYRSKVLVLINVTFDLSLQRFFRLYVRMFQYHSLSLINLWLDRWIVFPNFTTIPSILRNFYKVMQIAFKATSDYFPSLSNLLIQLM